MTNKSLWKAFVWMAGGSVCLTLVDFFMKLIALEGVHPATAFFYATPLSLLIIYFLAGRSGGVKHHLVNAVPWAVLVRGGLMMSVSYLNFIGMMHNPYSQQVMIFQLSPILSGFLALLLLREGVGKHHLGVMALCLLGTWLVIDPRFGAGSWYLLLPLGAAISNAFVNVFVAANRDKATALGYTFYGMLLVAVVSGVIHFSWQLPSPDWKALLYCQLIGGLGVLGLASVTQAIQLAGEQGQTGKVALMYYVQMPVALVLGYFALQEVASNAALLGAVLILVAGISLPLRSGVQAVRAKRNQAD